MSMARIVCILMLVVFSGAMALADKKKIDNPEFMIWSKYKADTSIKLKTITDINGMKTESVLITTLKEVAADKLVLETEAISKFNGMEFKSPPTKRDVAKTLEVDEKLAEQIGKGPAKPEGTTEEGTETVKVGKDSVKTKWYKFKTKTGDTETESQTWTSEDVPGSVVKVVTKSSTFSSTTELVEFVKK